MSEGGLQGCRSPFSFNHPNFNYGEFAIIKHEPGLIIDSWKSHTNLTHPVKVF